MRLSLSLCLGLGFSEDSMAQSSQPLTITDSYGMSANQAIASETGPDRLYAGFGSSFAVLDPTQVPPVLVAGLADNPAHLLGFVRDIDLVRGNSMDRAYVAAGPRGLVSYDLVSGAVEHVSDDPYSAFAVAALDVEHDGTTKRIVFVGTNHDDMSGSVSAWT
ncbi:MAG: hypothetical protein HY812_18190 [Planctomycetes bacterium]|nr:hypothetical protein [Planctomycetota bacterium]